MNEKDAAVIKVLSELGLREDPPIRPEFENLYPNNDPDEQFYDDVIRLFKEMEQSEMDVLFDKTATAQRGVPERIMGRIQHEIGGGVFSFVIEHVGDLTHRMSESVDYLRGQHGIVQDKVDKTLRVLIQGYGFEREHEENLRTNFEFKQKSGLFDNWASKVRKMSQQYADAHKEIPVYNWVQETARDAAIALGEWDFKKAARKLTSLQRLLQDREQYQEELMQYKKKAY